MTFMHPQKGGVILRMQTLPVNFIQTT